MTVQYIITYRGLHAVSYYKTYLCENFPDLALSINKTDNPSELLCTATTEKPETIFLLGYLTAVYEKEDKKNFQPITLEDIKNGKANNENP